MKAQKWIIPLAVIGVICLLAAPVVTADDMSWRTSLRLSEPTEIPGALLPAGDYVIKVVDTQQTRSIVQFLNADESQVVATVLAVPNYKVRPAENTEFIYFQRSAGSPPALKSWVYPGNNYGVEFVYPKLEAVTISTKTNEAVYATPAPTTTISEPVIVVTPEKEAPLEEPAPLPKTASDLPAIGLFAVISLAGAAGLRLATRG